MGSPEIQIPATTESAPPLPSPAMPHPPDSSFPLSSSSSLPLTHPTFASFSPQQFANLIPTKLEHGNFLLWKTLLTPILESFDLYSVLDGSEPCPPQNLPNTQPNPAYPLWISKDRTCKIILHASLSKPVLPFTVGSTTAKSLWDNLEHRFSAFSRSHILQLKSELTHIRKGNSTMSDYLEKLKSIADALAAAGAPLDDLDLVAHTLRGLPADYDSFGTSIRVRAEPITPSALHSLLISEEMEYLHRETLLPTPNSENSFQAFNTIARPKYHPKPFQGPPPFRPSSLPPLLPTPSHPAFVPRPPSFTPPYRRSTPNTFRCQICHKNSHTTATCRFRTNTVNYANQGSAPARFSAMTATTSPEYYPPSTWYADSGATHHITNDINNLSIHSAYPGPDKVYVGNGQGLPISRIGHSIACSSNSKFLLHNVLYVPDISHNLLSVKQFVADNPCEILLTPSSPATALSTNSLPSSTSTSINIVCSACHCLSTSRD